MSSRTARIVAVSVLALCVVAVALSVQIGLAAQERIEPGQIVVIGDPTTPRTQGLVRELEALRASGDALQETTGQFNVGPAILVTLLAAWMSVGVLIIWRQPAHWAGWLFIITGAPLPLLTLAQALVIYGAKADPGAVPLLGLWATVGEYALYPIALLPLLFLLYPDGHPPSRRWRWAVAGLVGGTAVAMAGFFVRPGPFNNWVGDGILYVNPFGIDALADVSQLIIGAGTIVALISGMSTLVAVRLRFKRSVGEERQRMRWLAFVASLAGFFFASMWILGFAVEAAGLSGENDELPIFELLFGLTAFTLVVGIPAAYLIAIFRHGLWQLDLVIRKAVQYTILVATFTLLGVVVVLGIPTIVFGVGRDTAILPVIIFATILSGAFLWIRPRAARMANRFVYGRRATPYEVLSEFSERVGDTYSVVDVLPRMAQLVADATGATRVDVWLRVGEELRPEVWWPEDAAAPTARRLDGDRLPARDNDDDEPEHGVEVRHRGEILGAITLTPAADDPVDPARDALLRDLAAQAGLVLRNVRLIEELRASRERLVTAQDQERRKLERNIHDGVQQQLVALSVQLGLLGRTVATDPGRAADMAVMLQERAKEALEDLRDLARGIYPPLLADQGLTTALDAQARKAAVPTRIVAEGIARYPQQIESAVYFSVLEALNNVAKYAEANAVAVSLEQRNGTLAFRVVDDGRGFVPTPRAYGTGLQGMADRLDAIGGTLQVKSEPGVGTTVEGTIPLP